MKELIGCTSALIVALVVLIFAPALYYFGGWITGHLLSWIIGDTVIYGLNYLFNTNRFTIDMLPTICGTLGVIGSFFKSTTTTSSNK
jgi:hypothetical protein